MPNESQDKKDRDDHKGWGASAAIIATSLLIAGVFLHTWVGERSRAAGVSQVSASLAPPAEIVPAR